MTEQELLNLIEEVETKELHQAPDYLKNMILHKTSPVSKQKQLIIYSLKTIAATAAALVILFTLPSASGTEEISIQEKRLQTQENIAKEKDLYRKKMQKYKDKISLSVYVNDKATDIYDHLFTIFEKGE